jgi:uncharacterized protein (DUF885 family)
MHRVPCAFGAVLLLVLTACQSPAPPSNAEAPPPAAPAGPAKDDAEFAVVVHELIEDVFRRHPTQATYLGVHKYDERLEDYSKQAVTDEAAALRRFRERVASIGTGSLSAVNALDREQVLHAIDASLLGLEVVRLWAKYPDYYSSGLTNSAYLMIKREFAPAEKRLEQLIAREKLMPAALAEARRNLENPPRIYTEIAIEQLDGNRSFFKDVVPAAFASVKDQALLGELKKANDAVVAALCEYKTWLQNDLLKRSNGTFALGADTYQKKLAADEMIDLPIDELLAVAEQDLRRNQAAFAETARKIDPGKSAQEVLAQIEADHPRAGKLLAITQGELDSIGRFMTEQHIVTVPNAPPARVQETPPFLRATTSASMEIPGPFETVATEAYYNMTLPDPKASAKATDEFMRQWYYAAISNVSVHEVWPGHYLQFLYAKQYPSEVRKVFGAASNFEGWAHYCEQMVIDEGFHSGDPRYRLAQIQDALLRDVRFIVGIRLHTKGMTLPEAEAFFVKEGYQQPPVARSETKRGTSDATYGYYTMGKLMILKLREDYRAKAGASYSLQAFHDAFIKLGPLPLPLVRKAMLGEVGAIF